MNSDFRKIPIAVIGLGLMGGSFARRLKELGHPVIGLNRTKKVAEEALAMGIVDSIDPKDLKKAERMSAQCIKLEPDNATYLDTYAWIFFTQGNYTLAKFYIESALEKDKTNSSELVDHYGDILFQMGQPDKALEQWKQAQDSEEK